MELGTIVGDQFAIERQAGAGGMGTVYRARDRSGREVALKVLGAPGAQNAERFVREAEILARLSHPSIVRYVAHGRLADGQLYLAMEWLEGRDLSSLLAERGLTMAESVTLAARAAEALGDAHENGVVHRDVKPSNIFLVDGDVEQVKIIDFGIARLSTYTRVTARSGAVVGTPGYIAPEQARGTSEPSSETDVFSLGCVLFEMLTGRPPFAGDHAVAVLVKILVDPLPRVSDLRDDVPPELDDLVTRMLAKDPRDRPRNGAAVAAELSALAAGAGDRLHGKRTARPPALTPRERRLVSVILAAAESPGADPRDARTVSLDDADATRGKLRRVVEKYRGQLDDVADGSVLVTLSGSSSAVAQASRAARCALAMRAALPEAAIVVATGLGVLADRLPVGEAVDRAARMLEDAHRAPRAGIFVDDATAGLLDARFEITGEPGARTLQAERDADEPVRTLLGRPSPYVGRERELGLLESLFVECADEQVARAALVTAPPGFGKTRLRQELLARIGARATVWIGAGDPMGTGSPFGLIGRATRRALGIRPGDPLAARREALLARVAERIPEEDRESVAEFLGELLDVPLDGEPSVQLRAARRDPVLLGDRMRWAFGRFLRAEAAARPLLLVLDDLHWGDLTTVKLIDATLRDLADCPIFALALARPEIEERFPTLWRERGTLAVSLGPLTRRTSERLVREHLGDDADAAAVARIVERADGNALYLEELIRATAEGKGEALPDTVVAILDARLQRLDSEARRVLRAASVFGQVFRVDGVRALLGGIERTEVVHDIVRDLVDREVLVVAREAAPAGEPMYAFRHVLMREAAYATLTDADRALGHRLAGAFLEQAGETDAVLVGEHFERGGERARAVARYRQAAEHALAGDDLEAALAWAARADRCGAEGDDLGAVRRVEAEAHAFRGANAEAARAGAEAVSLLRRGSAAFFLAAADLATAKSRLDEIAELSALADDLAAAEAEPGALGPHLVALARSAIHLVHVGRDAQVARLVARVDELVARSEPLEPTTRGWLDRMRAIQAIHAGDPAAYLDLTAAAAASFEAAGDQRSASMQRGNVGYAYMELGCYAEAVQALRDAREISRRLGAHHNVMLIQHNLGLALARGVEVAPTTPEARAALLAEATALEAESDAAFIAHGHPRLVGFARLYLARIRALAGDLDDAARLAAEAAALLVASPPGRAPALATLAQLALARGRTDEALAHAREAMALLASLGGIEEGEALIRLAHAEALHAAGESDLARAAIAEARERLLARAACISKPELRESFLARVPENAHTLALDRAWVNHTRV